MYNELFNNLKNQLRFEDLKKLEEKTWHLGVFVEPYLTYMLDGRKTIESRFSKNKSLPYRKIAKDDIVFVKKSGGDVLAYFTIKDIIFFDLNETSIDEIKQKYNEQLCVSEEFYISKSNSKYATLIVIDKMFNLKSFHINKKGMQTWLKLEVSNEKE